MKQTKTNIFWAFLALLMGLVLMPGWVQAQTQTVEDGTAEHPFLIESKQELIDLFNCLEQGRFYHDGNSFTKTGSGTLIEGAGKGSHFKLTTNIFLNTGNISGCEGVLPPSGMTWTPRDFAGTLDGDGHVISGLYINVSTNDTSGLGLFRTLTDTALVKNLGLVNAYVHGHKYVSALSGMMIADSRVENCFVDATIVANDNYMGLITAVTKNQAKIQRCYVTGRVSAEKENISFLGGIVGKNMLLCEVNNCYSSAIMDFSGGIVGGIAGQSDNDHTMINCYYDKQLCNQDNRLGEGYVTSDMTESFMADKLGSAFGYVAGGAYPQLKAFSLDNPAVRLSLVPLRLPSTDENHYSTMDNLKDNFQLGTAEGATWDIELDNGAAELSGTDVILHKQGWMQLVISKDDGLGNTYMKTYELRANIAPYLGTEDNPYTIDSLADLKNFRDGNNTGLDFKYKHYIVPAMSQPVAAAAPVPAHETHWFQTVDIDMGSETNWGPIGTAVSNNFQGIYDGGGHTISNLKITSGSNVGLFGVCQNATIKNLGMKKANVKTTSNTNVSILCAQATSTNFLDCYVDSCFLNATNKSAYMGGICGNGGSCVFKYCHNTDGSITGSAAYTAGILGYCSTLNTVSYCYNKSSINVSFSYGVAGIVGGNKSVGNSAAATVRFCYNTADVTNTGTSNDNISAGIASRGCDIRYCFNIGNIKGTICGGIGGREGYGGYCFNSGDIISTRDWCSGINGETSGASYSCNFGTIYASSDTRHGGIGAIAGISHSYSVGPVYSKTVQANALSNSPVSTSSYDITVMGTEYSAKGTKYTTSQMIGPNSKMKSDLGTAWLYEEGMYPRLAWTDSLDWARDVAIAACTPIYITSIPEDVTQVKPGHIQIGGCDSNVVWKVDSGDLFTDFEEAQTHCSNNRFAPTVADISLGPTVISAYTKDGVKVKSVTLRRYYPPVDTLTVDNLEEFLLLQRGVNSDSAFYYKGHIVPRFADSCIFRLTADLTLPAGNWASIGGVTNKFHFGGTFLGGNHTISGLQSSGQYTGLFGRLQGNVYDLNLTNVNITAGGEYTGAVAATLLSGGRIENCTVRGSITGASSYTAGIAGTTAASTVVRKCKNYATVKGGTQATAYVAGIVASSSGLVSYCENYGAITSASGTTTNQVAGISCTGGTVSYCANMGEITGTTNCQYTGGVRANGNADHCYNTAKVTAKPGSSTADHYVGGVSGNGTLSYCYNAGQVSGYNRKYVGALNGSGQVTNSYNSNYLSSFGSGGSISGANNTKSKNCFFDNQMSINGALANVEYDGRAYGLPTLSMLGTELEGSTKLGTSTDWVFETGLYPRIKGIHNTDAAYASVMPVILDEGQTSRSVGSNVDYDFQLRGCIDGQWTLSEGANCLVLNTGDCNVGITGLGIATLSAGKNNTAYKDVRLLIQVSERNPLLIKSKAELEHFREGINREYCYYKMTDSTYQNTLSSDDSLQMENFICIRDGGRDLYFRLLVDVDLSAVSSWAPIGTATYQFQGHFNGDGHTVSELKINGSSSQYGLFGYMLAGSIKNLNIDKGTLSGSGQYKGLLCGYNYGGTIDNCRVTNSSLTGSSTYTGPICGSSYYGTIKHCYSDMNTISSTGAYAGGICGHQSGGAIDSCHTTHLTMAGSGNYKGGIVSLAEEKAMVRDCIVDNSSIMLSSSYVGGIIASLRNSTARFCISKRTIVQGNDKIGGIAGLAELVPTIGYCQVSGGSIVGKSGVGGIIGEKNNNTGSIFNCSNFNSVEGNINVGGVIGNLTASISMSYCDNYGRIYSQTGTVGGIVGNSGVGGTSSTSISYCCNYGEVNSPSNYVGGIVGKQTTSTTYIPALTYNYNMGMVKGAECVGGIMGSIKYGYVNNCFNVAIVEGVSKVGGIFGDECGATRVNSKNINIGWIWGRSFIGAICGSSVSDVFQNNFYDSQMVNVAGINNEDVAGKAEGRLTSELTGDAMKSILGTTYWVYQDGMYPRIKNLDTLAVSIAAASPIYLEVSGSDTVRATDMPSDYDFTMAGCPDFNWRLYQSNHVDITGCSATTKDRGYTQISIHKGNDTLKVVQISVRVSEEHPLEIKDEEQLKNFRDLINSNKTFYYDSQNEVFSAQDNSTSENRFISIQPGGDRMFFALSKDMDLTLESASWTPIGTSSSYFKGHFNGRGYTVKGMKITTNTSNQGFFGYAQGTIKNLIIDRASITGTGDYHGALCARNYAVIENCGATNGTVKGSSIVGGLVGYNSNGQIDHCYNENFVQGTSTVGGIVGKMETGGYLRHSINTGFVTATAANSYAGGLVGNTTMEVSNCYNTGNVNGGSYVGGIAGYCQTPNLKYCYNTGYIHSTASTLVGAITTSSSTANYPTNCYFDIQLSGTEYGLSYSGGKASPDANAKALYTEEMTTSGQLGSLPTTEWTFENGMYPQLTSMADKDVSAASATPVFISERKFSNKIVMPFSVALGNDVVWDRRGDGTSLDLGKANTTGDIGINSCGTDTLQVTLNNDKKWVTTNVEHIESAAWRDTICDGQYRWAANGRIYDQTGDYTQWLTHSEGCDSVVSLHLVIPEALVVTLDVQNRSCHGVDDGYAKAEVKGGFGTYNYYWYKAEDMETAVSTTLNTAVDSTKLPDPQPGNYVLLVEDAVHPSCSKTYEFTISEPDELVAEVLGSDSRCLNQNDGYINLGVFGGSLPYKVSWTTEEGGEGSKDDFNKPDTTHISDALPVGNYTVVVTDDHNCQVTIENIVLKEDATPYVITAYSESRKYNAEEMDGSTYTLKIGNGTAEQHHSGDTVVLSTGDSLKVVLEAPKMTDAGTASNNILSYSVWNRGEDRTCRYNIDPHNGTLEILKRNVTITSGTSQRGFIDGQPLTNHTVTVTGDGFLPEKGQDTANVEVTGTITNAGSVANTFTCYYTEALNRAIDNYNITKKEGTLTIAADGEIIITAPSDEKKYDGTPLTVASDAYMVAGLHTGDTVINLQVVNLTITDAGSITTSIDTSNFGNFDVVDKLTKVTTKHNYDSVTLHTGTLTVTKREVSLTSNSKTDQIYNGDTLKLPTVTVGGDGFVAGEVDTVYAVGARCSVGDSLNRIVIEGSYKEGNYVITKNEGHLTVLKKDLSIIGDDASYPYDGVEHVKNTYKTPSLISTHTISGVTYEAKGSTVGDYVGVFSDTTGVISIKDAAGNEVKGNYNITLVPGTLHITPNTNPLVISSARGSFVFDGVSHLHTYRVYSVTYKGSQVTGSGVDTVFVLSTGDTVTITPVNAGRGISQVFQSDTNDFTYSITHQDNYANVTLHKDSIIVTPRLIDLWSGDSVKTYDGVQAYCPVVTLPGNRFAETDGMSYSNFPTRTDVGTTTNTFDYSMTRGDIRNYRITTQYGMLKIDPAMVTLTPKDTFRGYGEDDPPFKFTASGLKNGEKIEDVYIGESRPTLSTNATAASVPGLYDIEIDTPGVKLKNYTIRLNKGTLTINKSKLTITAKSPANHLTYDGVQHNFGNGGNNYLGVTTEGMMADDSVKSVLISGVGTVAGTYDITLSSAVICRKGHPDSLTTNYYDITYNKGQFVIDPVAITLQPKSLTHIFNDNTYNADSTEAPHYDIVAGALVPHDSIVGIRISGSRLMPGVDSLVIDPASIIVVDTNEVKNYTMVDAHDNMAGGYKIMLKKGYVKITDRGDACYHIDLKAKSAECIYGESASASGLEQTEFDIDGHHYTVTGLTANATNSAVGTWPVPIVGDSVVVDAYGNDVTSQFCITKTNGQIIVHPRPLRIKAKDFTVEYDGQEHTYKGSGYPYFVFNSDTALLSDHSYSASAGQGSRTFPGETPITIIPDSVKFQVTISHADVTSNYQIVEIIPGKLTITPPATPIPLTVSSKSDTVNYDGEAHTLNGFDTLKLTHNGHVFTISGISATVTGTEIGSYKNAVTGTLKVTDDQGNNVTAYFAVTVDTGSLTINGYPQKLTISSESHRFDCYNKGQKYEHYTVKYGETACAAVAGSKYKFVLAPVTGIHDTLTITPTCAGTTNAGSHDNVENTFTYVLQNNIQYVGTRDTAYGYLTQPDTLTLALTKDEPFCGDGSIMSLATGGNGGNKFHLSTAAATDSTTHGTYNGLSAGDYTVSVTDSKHCVATASVTLTTVEATAIEGITRAGEITTYAPDTTVDASGNLTAFPALTASGDIIAQPKLSNCTASVTDHKITVSVTVESIGVLPILVFEVSKDAGFSTTEPMYTHKVAPVTEGDKTYDFENLPTGTYYVRAKLYNCAGGSITATPESATVEVEH